jgi:dephospho-CoA kinase
VDAGGAVMTSPRRPLVIGLVGGVGSGKTTVARVLSDLGCVVVESDEIAREVLDQPDVQRELVQWWGDSILEKSGTICRQRIAEIVFRDSAERSRLESLTHPLIEARRKAIFDAAPAACPALVIDAPLLIEAGLQEICDLTIMIDTPREVRVNRVLSRQWTSRDLDSREAAQLPLDEKRSMADHVVRNTGDLEALRCEVETLFRGIIEHHA